MSFEKLIMDALSINGGIEVWSGFGSETVYLDVSYITKKFDRCYAVNHAVVAFCYRQTMFVIPYTRAVIDTITKKNFRKNDFFVPFSNGEFPKYKNGQWSELLKAANRENAG